MATIAEKSMTKEGVLDGVRALLPTISERAAAAEEARQIPAESARDLLAAGMARILAPKRYGGYELGLDTWVEAVRLIGTADASHAWCASLITHHPHYIGQMSEAAQEAVWADGPDIAIAVSVLPVCKVVDADGGYRITGKSPFTSGITHSTWTMVGGFLPGEGPPRWALFLVHKNDFEILDTWDTIGMNATGSNTVVTDDLFVAESHILFLDQLVEGTGPGGEINENPMYSLPFMSYAPLTFAIPQLGAVQGAFDRFSAWEATRKTPTGDKVAEHPTVQVRVARAAASLDAAQLLLDRCVDVAMGEERPTIEDRARSMRDFARAVELTKGVMDELMELSGTSGFATSNANQRAWRDVNFASRHISLSPDINCSYWSQLQLGLERDPRQAMY